MKVQIQSIILSTGYCWFRRVGNFGVNIKIVENKMFYFGGGVGGVLVHFDGDLQDVPTS